MSARSPWGIPGEGGKADRALVPLLLLVDIEECDAGGIEEAKT